MPYAAGTASSATDLRTALVNLATANGWTWDSTNQMLYKAPVYVKLTVSGAQLRAQSALGYSGGVLTSPAANDVCITDLIRNSTNVQLSYPLTYHLFLHTNPDDIFLAVNYSGVFWQHLAFGNGRALGGTANPLWQWGTANSTYDSTTGISGAQGVSLDVSNTGGEFTSGQSTIRTTALPFWTWTTFNPVNNSAMYCGTDGNGWISSPCSGIASIPAPLCRRTVEPLLATQPNNWNGESILIPCVVAVGRTSGFYSNVAELPNLRYVRNDNLSDGQIVTLGTDKWFCVPAYRKNLAYRNGSINGADPDKYAHSGTLGVAIRYDGM